jgi:YfiH family protein
LTGVNLIEPDWPAPANVIAFTTLRPEPSDDALGSALPAGVRLQHLRQVHGSRVVIAPYREPVPAADASVSRLPGQACLVRSADCLPILLCNRDGDEVAAVHAGWRGLAGGVLEAALAALHSPPADLLAWLGPAISSRHFEVGPEVLEAFVAGQQGAEAGFTPGAPGKYQCDLLALARLRLQRAGVTAVFGGQWCTFADPVRFYSHRRGADPGRLLSVICFI